jgi:microcystin-dependent protein
MIDSNYSNELAELKAQIIGELQNQIKVQGVSEVTIVPGIVVAWYGFSYAIPSGWHLCDGTNGTPDLRGKFILGTDNLVGATGGEATHKLTIAEMPSHAHSYTSDANVGSLAHGYMNSVGNGYQTTGQTGGDGAHNNMPPYCTLLYIMKL